MRITIDFETYYDKQFSLSKMQMDDYIRDPRFKIHGVGVAVDDSAPQWFAGRDSLSIRDLPWESATLIAQNAYFDAFILHHWYKVVPGVIRDTMSMGRALYGPDFGNSLAALAERLELGDKGTELQNTEGKRILTALELERLGQYCCSDVALTRAAFNKMIGSVPPDELRLIDITIRMFTEPMLRLNRETLEANLAAVQQEKRAAVSKVSWLVGAFPPPTVQAYPPQEIDEYTHCVDILMSNDKFSAAVEKLGYKVPQKRSPSTGDMTSALSKKDIGFIKLLESKNQAVVSLAEARLAVKSTIEETRTARLLELTDYPLSILLYYYGAHTGRDSGGGGINPQNLPRNSLIRQSLTAPPGHVLMVIDSGQIEARVNAWLAGDALLESFRLGRDVYSDFAEKIFGYRVDKSTPHERLVGKICQLGLGYQMSAPALKSTFKTWAGLDVTDEESETYVRVWRNTYQKMVKQWYAFDDFLDAIYNGRSLSYGPLEIDKHGIRLPNGLYIKYRGLAPDKSGGRTQWTYVTRKKGAERRVSIYGGKVVENAVQALARIIVFTQILQISERYKLVLRVHDEGVWVVPEKEADSALEFGLNVMRTPPAWCKDMPLAADGGYANHYGK